MKTFKDFNIKPVDRRFIGESISIRKILNVSIKVLEFKIEPSKKKPGTDFMTLQIEKDSDKRVVFTGSNPLMNQIKLVPRDGFPFETTIVNTNEYYEFT